MSISFSMELLSQDPSLPMSRFSPMTPIFLMLEVLEYDPCPAELRFGSRQSQPTRRKPCSRWIVIVSSSITWGFLVRGFVGHVLVASADCDA